MIPIPYADENPSPSDHEQIVALILLNSAAMAFSSHIVFDAWGFIPANPDWYRWLTSQFLHADVFHLLGNVWALWIFGDQVAARMGRGFLPFYLAGGASANLLHMVLNRGSSIPAIGASGAICAVIGAYCTLYPRGRIKCFTLTFRGDTPMVNRTSWIICSISAFCFGVIYIGFQFFGLWTGGSAIAYGAHIGGLFFGVAVASVFPHIPDENEIGLSGPAGSRPAARGTAGEIAAALENNQEEVAIHQFIAQVRQDPYFELPESPQLHIADKLAGFGYPHLAKTSLNKFLLRHSSSALVPHAHLLLGYLEQVFFKDFEAAARSYMLATEHPKMSSEQRQDAQTRLQKVRDLLDKTTFYEANPNDSWSVLLESSSTLTETQRNAVAAIAEWEEPTQQKMGFLMRNAEQSRAVSTAERLEKVDVHVVIVPHSRVITLPAAQLHTSLSSDLSGISLSRDGPAPVTVAWKDCLLLAVFGLPWADGVKSPLGIFEIDFESMHTMENHAETPFYLDQTSNYQIKKQRLLEGRLLPCLEIITNNPLTRHRWIAAEHLEFSEKALSDFFDAAQETVLNSVNVPVNVGAQEVFARKIPRECFFKDLIEADLYLNWQVQLAALKKQSAYS